MRKNLERAGLAEHDAQIVLFQKCLQEVNDLDRNERFMVAHGLLHQSAIDQFARTSRLPLGFEHVLFRGRAERRRNANAIERNPSQACHKSASVQSVGGTLETGGGENAESDAGGESTLAIGNSFLAIALGRDK